MSYAKHVEVLQGAKPCYFEEDRPSFDAAIEALNFRQAAEPKDAEAEAELVRAFVAEFTEGAAHAFDFEEECEEMRSNLRRHVHELRAAARAEGYAQADEDIKRHIRDKDRYRELLTRAESELTSVQAEFVQLSDSFIASQNARVADKTEIERLQEVRAASDRLSCANYAKLETKLSKLRAEVLAAYEASR